MSQKRSGVNSGKGSAKIRFVMLEADIEEGDFANIAQAITSALRPPGTAVRALSATVSQRVEDFQEPGGSSIEVNPSDVVNEGVLSPLSESSRSKAMKGMPRKYRSPKVINDVDLDSGNTPFAVFAEDKRATETTKRYLVVAAWFKEQRGLEFISSDHVYTCYRKMGWSLDLKDVGQPFRDLTRQGWGDTHRGQFGINHIGLDVVNNKMGKD